MGCKCFERKTQFTDTTSFDDKYKLSKCRCTSRFTVGENKSKFTIVSKQVSEVDKIKIDGYFDSSSKHRKCDYLFVYTPTSPSNCIYIFVELKGTDIAHAVTQIGNTVNLFYNQGYLKDKKVIGAIVSSRHPSNDGTYRKAKQTLEKSLSSKIKTLSKILCKWKQDSAVSLFLYLDSVFKNKHKLIHNQAPVMNRLCPFLLNLHK